MGNEFANIFLIFMISVLAGLVGYSFFTIQTLRGENAKLREANKKLENAVIKKADHLKKFYLS